MRFISNNLNCLQSIIIWRKSSQNRTTINKITKQFTVHNKTNIALHNLFKTLSRILEVTLLRFKIVTHPPGNQLGFQTTSRVESIAEKRLHFNSQPAKFSTTKEMNRTWFSTYKGKNLLKNQSLRLANEMQLSQERLKLFKIWVMIWIDA